MRDVTHWLGANLESFLADISYSIKAYQLPCHVMFKGLKPVLDGFVSQYTMRERTGRPQTRAHCDNKTRQIVLSRNHNKTCWISAWEYWNFAHIKWIWCSKKEQFHAHASENRVVYKWRCKSSHMVKRLSVGSFNQIVMNFKSKYKSVLQRKCIWKCSVQHVGHFMWALTNSI